MQVSVQQNCFEVSKNHSVQRKAFSCNARTQWDQSIAMEARKRAMMAAFLVDTQHRMLISSSSSRWPSKALRLDPNQTCLNTLWACNDFEEWNRINPSMLSVGNSISDYVKKMAHGNGDIQSATTFEVSLAVAYIATYSRPEEACERLEQCRTALSKYLPWGLHDQFLTSHSYSLTLCTPMQDLLSVVGESWVFGTKLHDIEDFSNARSNLDQWTETPSARTALSHAARILCQGFDKQEA